MSKRQLELGNAVKKRKIDYFLTLPLELVNKILVGDDDVNTAVQHRHARGVCHEWKSIIDNVLWCDDCLMFCYMHCTGCGQYGCSCKIRQSGALSFI